MTQDNKIVGIWQDSAREEPFPAEAAPRVEEMEAAWVEPIDPYPADPYSADELEADSGSRMPEILAAGATVLWLAAFIWLASGGFTAAPAAGDWPSLIAMASAPLALIGVLYLLATRRSLRGVNQRHSALMALESQADTTLAKIDAIGGFVDRARQELEAKANILASHGMDSAREMDRAARVLGEVTDRVAVAQRSMASESDRATTQAQGLLDALPRIEDVAERASERFREAGLAAHKHGSILEAQLAALGVKADEATHTVSARIATLDEQSTAMTGRAREAAETIVQLMEEHARALTETEQRAKATSEAVINLGVSHIRSAAERLQSVRDSFGSDNERWLRDTQDQLAQSRTAAEALAEAIAASEARTVAAAARIQTLHGEEMAQLQASAGRYDEQLGGLTDRLGVLRQTAVDCDTELARRVSAADGMRERAEATLVAIEAALRELEETLPGALERIGGQLDQHQRQLAGFTPQFERYETVATATAKAIEEGASHSASAADAIAARQEALQSALATATEQAADMRRLVGELGEQLREVTDGDAPRASAAIESVRAMAVQASERARASLDGIVTPDTGHFAAELDATLEAALRQHLDHRIDRLREGTEKAVGAAAAFVDDATSRIAAIPVPQAEPTMPLSDMLARRVSALTQSLQSAGVNVAEMLGAEVSDDSWNAYLTGDRSLFVRRANRLLDQQDGRVILSRYGEDSVFRGHVNRYIADFEAMLRELLASGDGQPLSVVVLSSDMGKLYVALATAIERLRP